MGLGGIQASYRADDEILVAATPVLSEFNVPPWMEAIGVHSVRYPLKFALGNANRYFEPAVQVSRDCYEFGRAKRHGSPRQISAAVRPFGIRDIPSMFTMDDRCPGRQARCGKPVERAPDSC